MVTFHRSSLILNGDQMKASLVPSLHVLLKLTAAGHNKLDYFRRIVCKLVFSRERANMYKQMNNGMLWCCCACNGVNKGSQFISG